MITGDLPAALGGRPVATPSDWPTWPRTSPATNEAIHRVLNSGRWAISGHSRGTPSEEEAFATAFADFCGSHHCVPVDHGSSAIFLALLACGIGEDDEVLVPALTWVACASAVRRTGATPVLVDVDRNSLCMDPFAARATITEQTRAILLVHLYCSVADLDTFLGIAAEFDLSLIEDAAQAHGAVWRGRKVGSIGRIGVFSMQQGKLLTAGEGGACITDDDELADRIYRLRTDGRRLRPNAQAGRAGLEEVGARGSANFCLSELQAACLSAQLLELEELNAVRWESARLLRTALREIPGVTLPVSSCGTERESYYHFIAFVAPEFFAGRPVEALCEALTADLGIEVHPVYDPLPEHPLAYDLQAPRSGLEGVRWVRRHALALHHPILLTGELGRTRIAEALKRLQRSAHLLPGTSASPSC